MAASEPSRLLALSLEFCIAITPLDLDVAAISLSLKPAPNIGLFIDPCIDLTASLARFTPPATILPAPLEISYIN